MKFERVSESLLGIKVTFNNYVGLLNIVKIQKLIMGKTDDTNRYFNKNNGINYQIVLDR